MKKSIALLMVSFIFLGTLATAQTLTKDEQKQLKTELKNYTKNLASFKKFKEDKTAAENRANDLQTQVDNSKKQLSQAQKDVASERARADENQNRLMECQSSASNKSTGIPPTGVWFTVQIGAYKDKDLKGSGLIQNNENFDATKDGGINKYILGGFDSYEKAKELQDAVRKMGLRDAWVVAYKDGQRVDVKQVTGGK